MLNVLKYIKDLEQYILDIKDIKQRVCDMASLRFWHRCITCTKICPNSLPFFVIIRIYRRLCGKEIQVLAEKLQNRHGELNCILKALADRHFPFQPTRKSRQECC